MNTRSKRKRVDWDAEIRKTENIRRRGIMMSIVSFASACAFIFGISKFSGQEFELPRKIISLVIVSVLFIASAAIFVAIRKRRKNHD